MPASRPERSLTDLRSSVTRATPTAVATAAAEEQPVVDRIFGRLDDARSEIAARRKQALLAPAAETPQARSERDAFVAFFDDRLRQLRSAEDGLVFGRLDRVGADPQYIGRLGLHDAERRQLLIDWRAPAAQDFYQATAAHPAGVQRRRHLKVRHRTVLSVHDDLLSEGASVEVASAATVPATADAALLAAVNEARSGRMRDIVVTLQAEQDRIIRSPLRGVLVVQGAPGTGKTAVALHRAAYLLYTHRDRLATAGVLLLGPNDRFLQYIEDVLPSLGETSVVSTTLTGLYPEAKAEAWEPRKAAALKGDLRMVQVLARAVQLRRRTPRAPIPIAVEGQTVTLTPAVVRLAQHAAERTGAPHNQARREFCRLVLDDLLEQLAAATGEPLDEEGRRELSQSLTAAPEVRREVNLCWMPLHPEQLLGRLWRDPDALAEAADGVLTINEQGLLHRPEDQQAWSPADIPLLDELAELIGKQPESAANRATRRRHAAEKAEQLRFAQDSLASLGLEEQAVPAELLASRYRHTAAPAGLEDAEADRDRVYGHVVVDEAQEVSPMGWRMVFRRCPTRSFTVVGDVDQTTSPAGTTRWADVFDNCAPGRWRLEELETNYRTPGAVMDLATRVAGTTRSPAKGTGRLLRSLRRGVKPVALQVPNITASLLEQICIELRAVQPAGTIAAIVAHLGAPDAGSEAADTAIYLELRSRCSQIPLLTAVEAKGLEFDNVLVLEPAEYLQLGDPGRRQLYVALTRATQRLLVIHRRPLPRSFDGHVAGA